MFCPDVYLRCYYLRITPFLIKPNLFIYSNIQGTWLFVVVGLSGSLLLFCLAAFNMSIIMAESKESLIDNLLEEAQNDLIEKEKRAEASEKKLKIKDSKVATLTSVFDTPTRSHSAPAIRISEPRFSGEARKPRSVPSNKGLEDQINIMLESQKAMTNFINSITPILQDNFQGDGRGGHLTLFLKEIRERKIHFRGASGEDAKIFIKRVEDCLNLIPLQFHDLQKALKEILRGSTRDWFCNHEHEFVSWEDFKNKFNNYFVPANYEAKLRQIISSRKQRDNEQVTFFISEIRRINNELNNPLTDIELIDTFKLNLHPRFLVHVHLAHIHSINDLEEYCVKIEKAFELGNTGETSIVVDAFDKANVECYKCHERGHFAKECKKGELPVPKPSPSSEIQDLTKLVQELMKEVQTLKASKN